jgi:hypothetical protein
LEGLVCLRVDVTMMKMRSITAIRMRPINAIDAWLFVDVEFMIRKVTGVSWPEVKLLEYNDEAYIVR